MRFLPRTLLKQTKRPGTEATAVRPHELVTLHVHCDQGAETQVRALCVLALSRPGARVEAVRVDPSDVFTTHLQMLVTLDGTETGLLDRLVDMLSGMPPVRDLHWHRDRHDDPRSLTSAMERGLSGACAH
ncbi:hypothetical protein ACFC0M_35805 [Streptomyces sp. NPDC056149]|uniref:hypothetical protein n=1 Tax=unclassified Streptomyces TaxID=2593676 RepID=UPI00238184DF|nr:hypothetical protein [Streptomyces sp. WZ-12]